MNLEELRKWKDEQEAAREKKVRAIEEEALQVEYDLSQTQGEHKKDFWVVATTVGVFAVKKPDYLTAKRFFDKKGDPTSEDISQFVLPNLVYPKREQYGDLFQEHGGLARKLCLYLMALYHGDEEIVTGK